MLYRHVFDKVSTEFCVFWWISRLCDGAKYQKPWLWAASFTYTNWRLKICIWRLYFSSWLPKGDLRIFLISSPVSRNYRCVRFVNLSVSCLGVCSNECSLFLDMMNDIGIDKKHQLYVIKKMINIAIRATYYIFCCRNRNWDSPDLMQFWFLFFSFFLFFFF